MKAVLKKKKKAQPCQETNFCNEEQKFKWKRADVQIKETPHQKVLQNRK